LHTKEINMFTKLFVALLVVRVVLIPSAAHSQRLWTENGVPVVTASGGQSGVRLASDNASGAYVVWEDLRTPNPMA
jgi:hypothetical protein